jgi:hypothetical protein
MFQCWDINEKANTLALKMGLEYAHIYPILFTKQLVEGIDEKIYCVSARSFCPF